MVIHNIDNIKEGDFVLIHSSKDLASSPYFIIRVNSKKFTGLTDIPRLAYIHGPILKSNVKNSLFTIYKHYPYYSGITKIIKNKNEIKELNLLYKVYLLQSS